MEVPSYEVKQPGLPTWRVAPRTKNGSCHAARGRGGLKRGGREKIRVGNRPDGGGGGGDDDVQH